MANQVTLGPALKRVPTRMLHTTTIGADNCIYSVSKHYIYKYDPATEQITERRVPTANTFRVIAHKDCMLLISATIFRVELDLSDITPIYTIPEETGISTKYEPEVAGEYLHFGLKTEGGIHRRCVLRLLTAEMTQYEDVTNSIQQLSLQHEGMELFYDAPHFSGLRNGKLEPITYMDLDRKPIPTTNVVHLNRSAYGVLVFSFKDRAHHCHRLVEGVQS